MRRTFHDTIPPAALPWVGKQTMVVVGSLDAGGEPWASLLLGPAGLLHSDDGRTLRLRLDIGLVAVGDPLWQNLRADPRIGLLLLESSTRTRLRINGSARLEGDGDCLVHVDRAYGNCPRYIQRRRLEFPDAPGNAPPPPWREGRRLTAAQQAWIADADTLFVASVHPEQGVDASHRGGRPGFVRVLGPRRLRIPDFAGNNLFNTLGNFAAYPHGGLLFIDFARGRILQLGGHPKLLWDENDPLDESGGTGRFWELEIERWRESGLPAGVRWRFLDYSPFLPEPREDDGGEA